MTRRASWKSSRTNGTCSRRTSRTAARLAH